MSQRLVQEVEKFVNAGYKVTKRREDILSLFIENDKYLSAREVQDALNEEYPGLSYDTIYRNLKLFNDLHILESTQLEGEMFYRIHCDTIHEHHHHFICNSCGETTPITDCPVEHVIASLPGYDIQAHRFEVFGLCKKCS